MCYSYPVLLNQFGEVTSAFRQMVFNSDCNNVWPHFMGVILCVYQYFILGHFFTIFLQRRLLNTEVADYYVIFKLPYCLGDMVTNMYMVNIFLNEILAQFDIGFKNNFSIPDAVGHTSRLWQPVQLVSSWSFGTIDSYS